MPRTHPKEIRRCTGIQRRGIPKICFYSSTFCSDVTLILHNPPHLSTQIQHQTLKIQHQRKAAEHLRTQRPEKLSKKPGTTPGEAFTSRPYFTQPRRVVNRNSTSNIKNPTSNALSLKILSQKKITQNISFYLTVNALHVNISPFPQGNTANQARKEMTMK